MLAPRPDQRFDHETLESIEIAVKGYLRRFQIAGLDYEELVQEVSLDLVKRGHRFDPGIASWTTFLNCVVRRTVATARRKQVRERMEKTEATLSIHTVLRSESGSEQEKSQSLDAENGSSPRQQFVQRRTEIQLSELRHDIQVVIGKLPSEQGDILRVLLEHPSVTTAAQTLGISRTQLQRRLSDIRDQLGPLGLHQES